MEDHYLDEENHPMGRSCEQRTMSELNKILVQFCALAGCGVCLSISPAIVVVASIIGGLLMYIQLKSDQDEDLGMAAPAPLEVDSSISDVQFNEPKAIKQLIAKKKKRMPEGYPAEFRGQISLFGQ